MQRERRFKKADSGGHSRHSSGGQIAPSPSVDLAAIQTEIQVTSKETVRHARTLLVRYHNTLRRNRMIAPGMIPGRGGPQLKQLSFQISGLSPDRTWPLR